VPYITRCGTAFKFTCIPIIVYNNVVLCITHKLVSVAGMYILYIPTETTEYRYIIYTLGDPRHRVIHLSCTDQIMKK